MICMKDDFKNGVTQTHAVLIFLVLYHQKFSLDGGCAKEDGLHTTSRPLQYQVRVVEYVTSNLVCISIFKYVNGDLQLRLSSVCVA